MSFYYINVETIGKTKIETFYFFNLNKFTSAANEFLLHNTETIGKNKNVNFIFSNLKKKCKSG